MEQAEVELARAEFEREQNEFIAALQQAEKEAAEAQQARIHMLDALAAYKAAAADACAEASDVEALQRRYVAAKETFERETAEAEAARETAAREQAEVDAAKLLKEQEEREMAAAAAALQHELAEASLAASAFEQVTCFWTAKHS